MRRAILAAAFLWALPLLAQDAPAPPPADSPIEFTDVVAMEGVSASELYTRAKLWAAKAFRDSKNTIEVDDKGSGILAGKALTAFQATGFMGSEGWGGSINFNFKVMVKDGRYKYLFDGFRDEGPGASFGSITNRTEAPALGTWIPKGWRVKIWEQLQAHVRTTGQGLVESLKETMATPSKGEERW